MGRARRGDVVRTGEIWSAASGQSGLVISASLSRQCPVGLQLTRVRCGTLSMISSYSRLVWSPFPASATKKRGAGLLDGRIAEFLTIIAKPRRAVHRGFRSAGGCAGARDHRARVLCDRTGQ